MNDLATASSNFTGKCERILVSILLVTFCLTASGQNATDSTFNTTYRFEDKDHSLTVIFKLKRDTVYVYYLDISGNGDYLNGFDEEEGDYAGKFSLKDFNGSEVNVTIKNYRSPDFMYNLNLQLNKKTGWIYWNINQKEPVGYLVKHATLKKCK